MSNITPVDNLKKTLSAPAMKDQFAKALPPHIGVEKFTRVLMTAVSNSPNLANAEKNSLFTACLKSAADGLLPDGKESAIVTFKNKQGQHIAQFMPMVSGILKKIRNSGELSTITAQIVHDKDKFRYWIDSDGPHLEHEPNMFGDRGKPLGAYAVAKTKDGGIYVEVLTLEDIKNIRNSSRSKDNGPWSGPFEHEMWKKSAIRRLSKVLPSSTDIDMTLHADDELFNPEETETKTVSESEPKDVQGSEEKPVVKKSKLKEAMAQSTETVKETTNVEPLDSTPVPDEALPI